jgi:hypothetical protein
MRTSAVSTWPYGKGLPGHPPMRCGPGRRRRRPTQRLRADGWGQGLRAATSDAHIDYIGPRPVRLIRLTDGVLVSARRHRFFSAHSQCYACAVPVSCGARTRGRAANFATDYLGRRRGRGWRWRSSNQLSGPRTDFDVVIGRRERQSAGRPLASPAT